MPELAPLIDALIRQYDITRIVVTMALILARVVTIVQLTPFLGGKNAPTQVKMGVAVALSLLAAPIVLDSMQGPLPLGAADFTLLMLKEVFIGLLIGFIGAELFYAVEMAGQFMNLLNGTTMVQLMVPELQQRSSAFGDLNYQLLLVIFLSINGHHVFLESMFQSFVDLPVNQWPAFTGGMWPLIETGIRIFGNLFLIAAGIAAPVGIACLVTDFTFGLLNRVAPQINAYFMSMPAKAMIGCIMFFVAMPMIIKVFTEHSWKMLEVLRKAVTLFQ